MTYIELPNLHHSDYEHPLDANALDVLEGTPGLECLTKVFIKQGIERLMIVSCTGSNLRVTPSSFPALFDILQDVCSTVNIRRLPKLYVEWNDSVNGFTVGDEEPVIVITSGSVDRLTDDELRFLIGHEMGHIKSRHTRYHMMADSISKLGEIAGELTLGIGKLLSTPVQIALYRWYRTSELTADRLGLLSCQSLKTAASVFVKMAGLPQKHNNNPCVDDFLLQAKEFEQIDMDQVNRWIKFATHAMHTHPWTVLRAAELKRWIDSGQYEALLYRDPSPSKMGQEPILPEAVSDCKHCPVCHAEIEHDEAFCANCGKRLN